MPFARCARELLYSPGLLPDDAVGDAPHLEKSAPLGKQFRERKAMTTAGGSSEPNSIRTIAFASAIGATIEWYDFFLYGVVAALVFNKLFFPQFDSFVGTLLAYTTFLVGFVARPVGVKHLDLAVFEGIDGRSFASDLRGKMDRVVGRGAGRFLR